MTVSTESNKALVRRIYDEMWNQGSLAAAEEIFTEPQSVEIFVADFLQAFPDLQHTVEELIAEDDNVVARFRARGTHRGKWLDFPATHRPVSYTGVTIARVENGRIVSHHTWWDTHELIEQIKPSGA